MLEKILGMLRKLQAPPHKPQVFTSVILPREAITNKTYKSQGIVEQGNIKRYFESCFLEIENVVREVYGSGFTLVTRNEDRLAIETFSYSRQTIDYRLLGLNDLSSNARTKKFSTDITGMLTIMQPEIDFSQLKVFFGHVLRSHLLIYRDKQFGLFYDRQKGEEILQGIPILQRMDMKPSEAAEYTKVMRYGGYRHKIFTEGELQFPLHN